MTAKQGSPSTLNAICPYFTMFPLEFPLDILRRRAHKGEYVLDPFCGRGTTNFAARMVGLGSLGVDSSRVAAAITASKLVNTTSAAIVAEARRILSTAGATRIPAGDFWRRAYHPTTLRSICALRDALLAECSIAARVALRGIVLGALHGPRQKNVQSYFSNQCPRTYAPKPGYALRYWKKHRFESVYVNVIDVIERRANRYYAAGYKATGVVRQADSRHLEALRPTNSRARFNWVITSPPYYGMRTYIPDQWLRNWFVGGPDVVDYSNDDQLVHSSPDCFAADLKLVWSNAAAVCAHDARLVIRFGSITDRRVSAVDLMRESLRGSGWRIVTLHDVGSATEGKRQADSFLRTKSQAVAEYDVWAVRR